MNLTKLQKGETGLIINFNQLSASFSRRLFDVGIAVGSEVTVLNILNFGHLYYISIDEVDFCIRRKDAEKIIVQLI